MIHWRLSQEPVIPDKDCAHFMLLITS
jgi:hypothetical protein